MKNTNIIPTLTLESQQEHEITLGLSACLAGHNVRFNGGHTQSKLCLNVLSEHFNYMTFCPEVAAGFATPRPTMRLNEDKNKGVRLSYSNDPDSDVTDQLVQGFTPALSEFDQLDGYILMKNSPSCGMSRIKVYQENGMPKREMSQGLFAAALQEAYPLMPIEEEGRLNDAHLYENFILRVYAHHYFRVEVLEQPSLHKLMQFHTSYKYILLSQNQVLYKQLGQLLAKGSKDQIDTLVNEYFTLFMSALSRPAPRKGHVNTLLHVFGYFKRQLSKSAKQSILRTIKQYQAGQLPLVTPLTLLQHYTEQFGNDYLRQQRYFAPYPQTLGLANHV
ncbi:hypothetical protein MED121_08673 [Marinomonas sp. MED121]|jgi:uncharacterized protein YbgA (DUF1722 family)/uncharacterized protein YbbK (DUF523 family)|uniref:YbgA family protein n=1 Tax=Marinomonas sp. MED121 TaxID=314277 RepID=UPI00006900C7|nr:DUF1722 domain-containing protein [Marinomonas sp. MED121]EAQ65625.1 hypothetical protein MED121_08673 [Marinomonas sp. MED121]